AISGFCLAIVQEMCARMGAVTGKGLADLIREQFGVRWAALAMLALLIANTGVTVSEFLGIAASVQVLANDVHTPFVYLVVPLSGLILWWLVIKGSYRRVEKVFLFISLGFLAYIPAAFAAHPSWSTIGRQVILPHLDTSSGYLIAAVALVGTTISPYMQFFVQSSVADKGIHASEYVYEQLDVYSSTVFAVFIAGFVLIAIIPGLPIFQVLVLLQDLNAAMLPILLIFIILLINNRRLMGRRVNNLAFNIISWATVVLITILIILFLLNQIFGITL